MYPMQMKTFSFFTILAFSSTLLWANTVQIVPGTAYTVPPSPNPVTVMCTATASILEKYCTYFDPGPKFMKRLRKTYVMSSGQITYDNLGDFTNVADCENIKSQTKACLDTTYTETHSPETLS